MNQKAIAKAVKAIMTCITVLISYPSIGEHLSLDGFNGSALGNLYSIQYVSAKDGQGDTQQDWALPAPAALNAGLIAYYPFDGNAQEKSGQYVDGFLVGNATFREGVIGQALYLDGDGDYVVIGNGLNLYDNYSVSFWVKSEDITRKWAAILAKYESNRYGPYDFTLHYKKANLWVSDGSGGATSIDSKTDIQENTWVFVVYSVISDRLKIYINGALDATETIPVMTQNSDRVTIGRQALMFRPYSDLEFKGYIDELRVYNRSLSASEIHKLMGVGDWALPVASPRVGQDFNCYGCVATKSGKQLFHTGMDMTSTVGRAVVAPSRGKVHAVFRTQDIANAWCEGGTGRLQEVDQSQYNFGNSIILSHITSGGQTIYTQYNHLSCLSKGVALRLLDRAAISEDQQFVDKQTFLGNFGNSDDLALNSRRWSPHLHFEVKSVGTLASGGKAGYASVSADSIGYFDPVDYLYST